jgi:hypothetical protein
MVAILTFWPVSDLHWHDLRHHKVACRWLAKGLDLRAINSSSVTPTSRPLSGT